MPNENNSPASSAQVPSHVTLVSGAIGKTEWRQYELIFDGRTTIIEMQPAVIMGWVVVRINEMGESDWGGMTADRILADRCHWRPETLVITDASIIAIERKPSC